MRMEIGIGLGFRMFIASFRAGFNELLFVSIALALETIIVNFDRSKLLMSHEVDFRGT